jgi:hypothetical protein
MAGAVYVERSDFPLDPDREEAVFHEFSDRGINFRYFPELWRSHN